MYISLSGDFSFYALTSMVPPKGGGVFSLFSWQPIRERFISDAQS
jgi:hypothetical protein